MSTGPAVSVHRMTLGAFEVTSVLDGFIELPPSMLQGDAAVIQRGLDAGGRGGASVEAAAPDNQ